MPIYEGTCVNTTCEARGCIREWYVKSSQVGMKKPCPSCSAALKRTPSRFGIVWTGELTTKYNDKGSENYHQEGHWAYKVRSSTSGEPEPVWIDTFQKQKEFCKQEGLVNPKDLPTHADVSADGKKLRSRGMPGAWI